MSSGNDTINSIVKKVAFHQSIKPIKIKFKIKGEFLFNHVYTETIKRIINDLDIKKPSSGEIPTYFFRKCDFTLDIVIVCVNSLKCANNRLIYKRVDPFDKNQ